MTANAALLLLPTLPVPPTLARSEPPRLPPPPSRVWLLPAQTRTAVMPPRLPCALVSPALRPAGLPRLVPLLFSVPVFLVWRWIVALLLKAIPSARPPSPVPSVPSSLEASPAPLRLLALSKIAALSFAPVLPVVTVSWVLIAFFATWHQVAALPAWPPTTRLLNYAPLIPCVVSLVLSPTPLCVVPLPSRVCRLLAPWCLLFPCWLCYLWPCCCRESSKKLLFKDGGGCWWSLLTAINCVCQVICPLLCFPLLLN